MYLKPADNESDWQLASEILDAVVEHLNSIGKPLWTKTRVSIDGLKSSLGN